MARSNLANVSTPLPGPANQNGKQAMPRMAKRAISLNGRLIVQLIDWENVARSPLGPAIPGILMSPTFRREREGVGEGGGGG